MQETKFIRLLKTLTEAEIQSFEYYLKSPWCNTNKTTIRLLEKIKSYHPEFHTPKLDKEKLFKRILPNGKFSHRRMNNILSDAFMALEQFLVFQNLQKDENLQQNLLRQEYQNRHLEDWFFKATQQKIEALETKSQKEWEEHLELLRLHRKVYHHPSQHPRKAPGGQTITAMDKQLDLIWLLEKATIINEKIFRNRILKNANHEVTTDLKKWRMISEGVEHPAIELYRMRFAYTEETMLEQYFELRNVFLKRSKELSKREQKTHFASLRNDTIRLIRSRAFDITELLPLYKIGLEQDLLMENGILPYKTFAAIVSASNTSKDFSFTEKLITIYSSKLDTKINQEAKAWAIAHTYYYKNNLEECLDVLLSNDFRFKYYNQLSKMLNTQVYFDLFLQDENYQDYLFSYFDSVEKWVQREKFRSQILKKSYLRFIQISRSLAKLFCSVNFNEEKAKNLLKGETNIQASEWLGRKIQQVIELKLSGRSN